MVSNETLNINYKTYTHEYSKDWIVFFHGIGGNYTIFKRQIDIFKEHYNLLFIDLPGHGNSPDLGVNDETLTTTCEMINSLLDKLNIKDAHFIGVSLGTILMQYMSIKYPDRIKSMVLAGAVGKWLKWGELIGKLSLSFLFRNLLPYMIPYIIFAHILMPQKNHKRSRDIFIREAHKLGKVSYLRWAFVLRDAYKIYEDLNQYENGIPKLYISGDEDHMFLKGIKSYVRKEKGSELYIIKKCGHVCNIEKSSEFNRIALDYIFKIQNKSQ